MLISMACDLNVSTQLVLDARLSPSRCIAVNRQTTTVSTSASSSGFGRRLPDRERPRVAAGQVPAVRTKAQGWWTHWAACCNRFIHNTSLIGQPRRNSLIFLCTPTLVLQRAAAAEVIRRPQKRHLHTRTPTQPGISWSSTPSEIGRSLSSPPSRPTRGCLGRVK